MGTPFLGEVKIISWNFAPKGWTFCNGGLLAISQNQALFSILGTTFGGDGVTTFALPDLRGRVPIHTGAGFTLGEKGGQEVHTVTIQELPTHLHQLNASTSSANTDSPSSTVMLGTAALDLYRQPTSLAAMDPGVVSSVGGSQPHENRQPFLTLNFIIALQGLFPSRN